VALVAALPILRKAGGKAFEGYGWLLLPGLHRQSTVCVPDEKHPRAAPLRDLQDQAVAQWLRLAFRALPGAGAWDAPKEIRANEGPSARPGNGFAAEAPGKNRRLP
jgi:hypothetical protein